MNDMVENIEQLKFILKAVKHEAHNFSGLGLIVYSDLKSIPIYPLRVKESPYIHLNTIDHLKKISEYTSGFHDGFHLLNNRLEITHVSQYFSPPIINNINLTREDGFGGRYLAALFGSCIDGIMLTGIASNNFGISIFNNGIEIYHEDN
ncbi:hypothetical protein AB7W11_02645 [Providencia manganoxydans]|uniref:hypothetical protein n=1 Tax=Providencia manganoxydans TaxID=2923283 RepID=UPI0034E5932F